MPDGWTIQSLKPLLDIEVGRVKREDTVRRSPVASGAPDLLNVLLQRTGSLVVDDVANVRLVDSHAEGAGRDHNQAPRWLHELMLGRHPIGSAHLAVILRDRDARPLKGARKLIDSGGSGTIDDPGSAQRPDASAGGAELRLTGHLFHRQAEVLAVNRSDEHNRAAQTKPLSDIPTNARRRGRRECEPHRVAEPLARRAEPQVGGPEVVPPLRDAVGLVHAEERRPSALERGCSGARLERFRRG